MQKVNQKGITLIQSFETLELEAYPDPGSPLGRACAAKGYPMRDYRKIENWQKFLGVPWTIGYGTTGPDIHQGLAITEDRANELFFQKLGIFEAGVSHMVKHTITNNQFSALVSLAYNIGLGNLEGSGLLAKINSGDFAEAASRFEKWNKSNGKVLNGLTKRRIAERDLFLSVDD